MKRFETIETLPVTQTTLAFLVQDDQVLLAMKKRGFGAGNWNGVGGKQNAVETIEQAMIREAQEEIGVAPVDYYRAAILNFTFLHQPEWSQQVHVYLVTAWHNDPTESDEMAPQWYLQNRIPYEQMWADDPLWLPRVLAGQKLHATFTFDQQLQVVEHSITELTQS